MSYKSVQHWNVMVVIGQQQKKAHTHGGDNRVPVAMNIMHQACKSAVILVKKVSLHL
jgi:hypothetical protein